MVLTDEQQAFLLYHELLRATAGISLHKPEVFRLLVELIAKDLEGEKEMRDAMLLLVLVAYESE